MKIYEMKSQFGDKPGDKQQGGRQDKSKEKDQQRK